MPEARFLEISVSMNAIATSNGEEAGPPGDEDDLIMWMNLLVEPVENHPSRFKLAETVTAFGLCRILNMGDVIEVEDHELEGRILSAVVERGRNWTHSALLVGGKRHLSDPTLQPLLDQLIEAGGMWELNTMRMTLQYPLVNGSSAPPGVILGLSDEINSVLGQLADRSSRSQ